MSEEFLDAVYHNDIAKVKRLLAAGVDVNYRDYSGPWSDFDAADIAADEGNLEMLRALLAAGAHNRSFVDRGIHGQHADIVREWLTLDEAKERIHDLDGSGGYTWLMSAARGGVEIVRLLVEGGVDVDALSFDFDQSALAMANKAGNTEVVHYLWPFCSEETRLRAGLPNDPRAR